MVSWRSLLAPLIEPTTAGEHGRRERALLFRKPHDTGAVRRLLAGDAVLSPIEAAGALPVDVLARFIIASHESWTAALAVAGGRDLVRSDLVERWSTVGSGDPSFINDKVAEVAAADALAALPMFAVLVKWAKREVPDEYLIRDAEAVSRAVIAAKSEHEERRETLVLKDALGVLIELAWVSDSASIVSGLARAAEPVRSAVRAAAASGGLRLFARTSVDFDAAARCAGLALDDPILTKFGATARADLRALRRCGSGIGRLADSEHADKHWHSLGSEAKFIIEQMAVREGSTIHRDPLADPAAFAQALQLAREKVSRGRRANSMQRTQHANSVLVMVYCAITPRGKSNRTPGWSNASEAVDQPIVGGPLGDFVREALKVHGAPLIASQLEETVRARDGKRRSRRAKR